MTLRKRDNYIARRRKKLEKVMYDIAVDLRVERGLTNQQIKENFIITIEDVIDLMDYVEPEISANGNHR
jgi:hypothetical protein